MSTPLDIDNLPSSVKINITESWTITLTEDDLSEWLEDFEEKDLEGITIEEIVSDMEQMDYLDPMYTDYKKEYDSIDVTLMEVSF